MSSKREKKVMLPDPYTIELAISGERADGRKADEIRPITIETNIINNAEGSSKVTLGDTVVIVGVKLGTGEPFPDKPEDGALISNAELSPLSSPDFEPGPPRENAIELARVVDRGIRESKMIETKKLCIKKGEKVWMVFVDSYMVNHQGNLMDAVAMGASAALSTAVFPKFDGERVVVGEKTEAPVPTTCKPVAVTCVKIGDQIFADPSLDEENSASAKLTVTTKDNGNVCAMQKSGGPLTTEEINKIIEISSKRGKEIRKLF